MGHDRRAVALGALAPYVERARSFSGWNFDFLDVREIEAPPAWDYVAICRERAARAGRVLDVATGGGEVLSQIVALPRAGVVATERWHVNAPVARDRLRPVGVDVVRARSSVLPFCDASFDLVLDRHEGIDPNEIRRVLGGRGAFVTQQVWRNQWVEAKRFFPDKTDWGDHLGEYRAAFRAAGYAVEVREHDWKLAYGTLGDFVFMMLVTPWEWPSFDVERDIERLLALEDAVRTDAGLVLTVSRYLLVAEWGS
ncbi:MAG: methyltransferase domain-containing protein [Dehalococcoidia bacterium]